MSLILSSYVNGNTKTTLLTDGTKIRQVLATDQPDQPVQTIHPESIDIKITDFCDLGCSFCHESSTRLGQHGDLSELLDILDPLPSGIELAIGGGNPLSHPDLIFFLQQLKQKGFIPNLTINSAHIKRYKPLLKRLSDEKLIYGLGVSLFSTPIQPHPHVAYITSLPTELFKNLVYHLVIGVHSPEILQGLPPSSKILLLGYKQWGFGVEYFNSQPSEVSACIQAWKEALADIFSLRLSGPRQYSFDNLAITQLNLEELLTPGQFDQFYMGDDFEFTMYIDGVKQEFAPTSRSSRRVSWEAIQSPDKLLTFFKS